MGIIFKVHIRKVIYGILLFGIILYSLVTGSTTAPSVLAAPEETPPSPQPLSQSNSTQYFTATTFILPDGTSLEADIISGPPTPPPGTELDRPVVSPQEINSITGQKTLTDVPAYNWVFGCSAVSGSMIAGYYDRNGFPNMYTGPTNGGVMPIDSSSWPTWKDSNNHTYPNNPLVASHNGFDGRATRGSIDDYWVYYESSAADPFIDHWTEHTWGSAIGDYMKTSQSNYYNTDGSTTFWSYNTSPDQLTCSQMETFTDPGGHYLSTLDGTYGRKLFYQAKGYTVTACYNQKTDNKVSGGFSFAQYKAEIDAGRPVMLNLHGHTIVGVGYNDTSNTVYIHDTWDYLTHSMTWGGSYGGMALETVSIVNIASAPPGAFAKSLPANLTADVPTTPTLSWAASSGATSYEYCYTTTATTSGATCDTGWKNAAAATSVPLAGLSKKTTYYWQVRAKNTGSATYADAGTWWHFTTIVAPPAAFNKTAPTNSATGIIVIPTLSWAASTGATSYEYCYTTTVTTSGAACDTGWKSAAAVTSASLSGLSNKTLYYWQVRANNAGGTTYANSGTWWHFTTIIAPPAAFTKTAPADLAIGVATNPTLSWAASTEVTNYEYCYTTVHTTNGTTCTTGWKNAAAATSKALSGLSNTVTYYWQVRANNVNGTTYADNGSWRRFTVGNGCQIDWQLEMTPADNGAGSKVLTIGQATNATGGLDSVCAEALLAVSPAAGIFDTRLVLPGGTQASLKDFRPMTQNLVTWTIKFQPGSGGYPFHFTWNTASLPSGSFYLRDSPGGHLVSVNMKTQNSYNLTNSGVTSLVIEYSIYLKLFLPVVVR